MSNTQTAPIDHMKNNHCWVTGELIPVGAPCRFTYEWDAWVSEEGQKRVWECKSDDPQFEELSLIAQEWAADVEEPEGMVDEEPFDDRVYDFGVEYNRWTYG
ncbi:MAG: hypothetical protein ACO395_10275 [Pontimonas sp.]